MKTQSQIFRPEEFRAAAAALEIAREDIASAIGRHPDTIKKMFRGGDTKISDLLKLARALGLGINIQIERSDGTRASIATVKRTTPFRRLNGKNGR